MYFYVHMQDKFLSGWGLARGKKAWLCVECFSEAQAQTIARNAHRRPEMTQIKIAKKMKLSDASNFVSHKTFNELTGSWKDE